jgi:Transglycosylase SLT domain
MRAIVAAAILLLGVAPAATEPEYPPFPGGTSYRDGGSLIESLVRIESTPLRNEHENAAAADATDLREQQAPASPTLAAPAANPDSPAAALPNRREAQTAPTLPLDQICNALLTSAQDNNLPAAFFANLIWQESRLRDNAVSPKGALGIAQFMPEVAAEAGLINPFDPLQALSASAHLLHALRDRFGNLGFVAAAYNAGAKRVNEWLQHGRTLPRETRGYVLDITGRSVEQWQKAPPADADLRFARRLPCRDVPTFVGLEEAQLQRSESEQAEAQQAQAGQALAEKMPPPKLQPAKNSKTAANSRGAELPKRERIAKANRDHIVETKHERIVEQRRERDRSRRAPLRTAEREHHRPRLEARDRARTPARGRHGRV